MDECCLEAVATCNRHEEERLQPYTQEVDLMIMIGCYVYPMKINSSNKKAKM